jgi:RNA polymerase sigma-70 factor (ECF subfamily)
MDSNIEETCSLDTCAMTMGAVDTPPDPSREMKRVLQLLERHRATLICHVKRILGCAEDAEDVVQETCLRLMRAHGFWRGERQVRAFLFKIATNLARDELRRRRACAHDAHFSYDMVDLVGEECLQPDHIVDRFSAMEAVSRALMSLPARYREVFTLHIEAQMSYRAISRRLGISAKTVERDMCGARALCQDRLRLAPRTGPAPGYSKLAYAASNAVSRIGI